ncbi:MAG: tyrosine-type recombinase/integrase [Anaerolineae bacterium]
MTEVPHPTVAAWLADLDRQGKSPLTQANYRRALVHFARWSGQTYGQPFDPTAIIPRDVADWKAFQQTVEGAKPSTINLRLVALSRYFKWAVDQGYVRSDPTAEVPGIRLTSRRPRSLDEVMVRRLLRQVHKGGNGRDIAMVELLLGTGLRISEALALRRGDVTLNERSGEVVVRRGKRNVHRQISPIYYESPSRSLWNRLLYPGFFQALRSRFLPDNLTD